MFAGCLVRTYWVLRKNAHACASVPCTTCCPILSSSTSGKLSKAKAVAQLSVARSVGHLSSTAVARRRFGFPGSPKLRSMERQRHCTDLLELVGHSPFALLRCRRAHAFVMFPLLLYYSILHWLQSLFRPIGSKKEGHDNLVVALLLDLSNWRLFKKSVPKMISLENYLFFFPSSVDSKS